MARRRLDVGRNGRSGRRFRNWLHARVCRNPDDVWEKSSRLAQLEDTQLEMMKYELPLLIDRLPSDGPGLYDWMEYPKLLVKAGVDSKTRKAAHGKLVAAIEVVAGAAEGREAHDGHCPHGAQRRRRPGCELIGFDAPKVEILWNSMGK